MRPQPPPGKDKRPPAGSPRRLTILHSNDIHGDLLPEDGPAPGVHVGGLALLSGYLAQVREAEENVLFTLSGDMLHGSDIDTEFRGLSTIELLNCLRPDAACLGNHELVYGLGQLLLLEKTADFPIVNANLYIRQNGRRLMRPQVVIEHGGLKLLFIGILTEDVLDFLRMDPLVGTLVSVEDAAREVTRIVNAYRRKDIDLTVLLTHIGLEADRQLAALLDPALGVDLILGGHSHSVMEQPEQVNGILIAQSGYGTNQVGRFDLQLDTVANRIASWSWRKVAISEEDCRPDPALEEFIAGYSHTIAGRPNPLLCRFDLPLPHPRRDVETPLGSLVCDLLAEVSEADLALVNSGFIRDGLPAVVTRSDLLRALPYDESLCRVQVTGSQLRSIFAYYLDPERFCSGKACFQVSSSVQAVYDRGRRELEGLAIGGQPVRTDADYTLATHTFALNNCEQAWGIARQDLEQGDGVRIKAGAIRDVLEEMLQRGIPGPAGHAPRIAYTGEPPG